MRLCAVSTFSFVEGGRPNDDLAMNSKKNTVQLLHVRTANIPCVGTTLDVLQSTAIERLAHQNI
jgi:acetamidase/formamidase